MEAFASGIIKAIFVGRAFTAQTISAVATGLVPDFSIDFDGQVSQRSVAGGFRPLGDFLELVDLVFGFQQAVAAFEGAAEPAEAQVVASAFGQYG